MYVCPRRTRRECDEDTHTWAEGSASYSSSSSYSSSDDDDDDDDEA